MVKTVDYDKKKFKADAYGNLYPKKQVRRRPIKKIRKSDYAP